MYRLEKRCFSPRWDIVTTHRLNPQWNGGAPSPPVNQLLSITYRENLDVRIDDSQREGGQNVHEDPGNIYLKNAHLAPPKN